MRKTFRFLLLFGSLAFLFAAGFLTTVYMIRVRLAQYGLDRMLDEAQLIEARASISSISPKSLIVSDVVLAGAGWRLEVDQLRSSHDAWSLRIHKIETAEGRLFVDVDQILESPSKRSIGELADLMEAIQSALPEMDFTVNRIQAEMVYMGRRIELTLSGEGSVSSAHQLAVSLEAVCGDLSTEVEMQGGEPGQVVVFAVHGEVAELARWMRGVTPSWREFVPVEESFDLDASLVTGSFHLELSRLRPVTIRADVGVTDLVGSIQGRILRVSALDSTVRWAPGEGAIFEAISGGLHLDEGRFRIAAPLARIDGRVGESIVVSSEDVLVEGGQVSGALDIGAMIPWPESGQRPVGTVVEGSITDLITFDHGWKPIEFDLEIEPDLARFRVRRLEIIEQDWPVLSDFEAILPLVEGSVDQFSWRAAIDLATDPAGPVSAAPDFPLSVSGDVSDLGSGALTGNLRIESSGGRAVLAVDGIGSFNTSGSIDLSVEVSDDDRLAAEIDLGLEEIEISTDRAEAEIASFALDLVIPPTPIDRLARLSHSSLLEIAGFAAGLELRMALVGDRLSLPGGIVLEWFDLDHIQGVEWAGDLGGADLQVTVSAATLRVAGESLQTIEVVRNMRLVEREIRSDGYLKAVFDGSPLTGRFDDRLSFGNDGQPIGMRGRAEFDPFEIRHSDLISRYFSKADGMSVSAILSLSADAWWSPTEPWDLSAGLSLHDGSLTYPLKNLQVQGIEGTLDMASLRDLHVEPDATWSFQHLSASDLVMDHGRITFGFDGTDRLDIVDLSFEAFDGQARLDPFTYSIGERAADLQLHVTGLDVGILLKQLDFFEGSFEGSIDGALPFKIRNGRVIPRQGRLELASGAPAFFRYRAEGLLTGGEEAKTLSDRIRLFPLQLVEKGLGNIQVDSFTVDLFDPDYPSSPVRIHLGGKAVAEGVEIPYFITTNINGTVDEALNFLFRLSSL